MPDNNVASLQEELAAAKLREAEANLALKDLKAKVAELSTMWKKHLQQRSEGTDSAANPSASAVPSTPKKLLGSFLEGKSEVARLEEELMTARLIEVENEAELKASRLKVMELETQVLTSDRSGWKKCTQWRRRRQTSVKLYFLIRNKRE